MCVYITVSHLHGDICCAVTFNVVVSVNLVFMSLYRHSSFIHLLIDVSYIKEQ